MNIITYRHSSIGGDKVNTDEKRIALIFKAFCDENRVRIIKLLRSGEKGSFNYGNNKNNMGFFSE